MITLLLLVRATYTYGVVLHAHPIRGESHNQRNTTGEVATPDWPFHSQFRKIWPFFNCAGHEKTLLAILQNLAIFCHFWFVTVK